MDNEKQKKAAKAAKAAKELGPLIQEQDRELVEKAGMLCEICKVATAGELCNECKDAVELIRRRAGG